MMVHWAAAVIHTRYAAGFRTEDGLIGIDQDEAAIEAARARLGEFKDKVTIIRSNYCNMKAELTKLHITAVDGILLNAAAYLVLSAG